MKSFLQIKKEAQRNDWATVAKLAECSSKNVKLVVNEERPDNYNIRKIFSDLLINRKEIEKRYSPNKRRATL